MISINQITKAFGSPKTEVLKGISCDIEQGEFVSLTGKSGSGKTTMLYVISSLDEPTSGVVKIDDRDIHRMDEKSVHEFRNKEVGFVFQFHYLLPELTALENILMPARKAGTMDQQIDYAKELLLRFDLKDHMHKLPGQLSGGQQQRVSVARAIVSKPRFLFADEPTGNLDSVNAKMVMDIFCDLNKSQGMTIVCVTHDPDFAKIAQRELILKDGVLS
jgi:ABC-type lipoprotein export system ATPase subunit